MEELVEVALDSEELNLDSTYLDLYEYYEELRKGGNKKALEMKQELAKKFDGLTLTKKQNTFIDTIRVTADTSILDKERETMELLKIINNYPVKHEITLSNNDLTLLEFLKNTHNYEKNRHLINIMSTTNDYLQQHDRVLSTDDFKRIEMVKNIPALDIPKIKQYADYAEKMIDFQIGVKNDPVVKEKGWLYEVAEKIYNNKSIEARSVANISTGIQSQDLGGNDVDLNAYCA